MQTFCTIITADYLPFAKTLYKSLCKYDPSCILQTLIVDSNKILSDGNFVTIHQEDISNNKFFKEIKDKYAHTNPDYFRWALKPVLIGHLLEQGYQKVIFADPDIFFVGEFDFLWQLLETNSILLTPHWANLEIIGSEDNLLSVLRNGLFNAGFVAANQEGLAAVRWWASMCHYKMEKKQELGIYDDQKYLDILPVQFDKVNIVKHQGCNLAAWNIQTCKRAMSNGQLLINHKYDPVFIHFTNDTIANIIDRNDSLLKPYLDDYCKILEVEGINIFEKNATINPEKYNSSLYIIKHKLRLRTRFKHFLFRLAEKL